MAERANHFEKWLAVWLFCTENGQGPAVVFKSAVESEIILYCMYTVPDEWATVSIHNSTGENALNNTDYTLTCTMTAMEGMTLPVTVEWVGPDGSVHGGE